MLTVRFDLPTDSQTGSLRDSRARVVLEHDEKRIICRLMRRLRVLLGESVLFLRGGLSG